MYKNNTHVIKKTQNFNLLEFVLQALAVYSYIIIYYEMLDYHLGRDNNPF